MSTADDFGSGTLTPTLVTAWDRNVYRGDLMTSADPRSVMAKNRKLARAWEAFDGAAPPPFKVTPGGADDNVLSGLCAFEVNTITNWVFSRDLEIEFPDDPGERLKAIVDRDWPMAQRMTDLHRARTNGGVCGQAFLRVLPDRPRPRTLAINPSLMSIRTAPDDYTKIVAYELEWSEPTPAGWRSEEKTIRHRQVHSLLETAMSDGSKRSSWTIQEWVSTRSANDPDAKWTKAGPAIAWPYPLPQFTTAQNLISNDAWGTADLEPGRIALVGAIDRARSQAQMAGRLSADGIFVTRLLDADGQAAFDNRPHGGSIHLTSLDQSVELIEFEGKGMAALLDEADRLTALWHKTTGIPNEEEIARAALGVSSGASMEMRHINLVQRIEAHKRSYAGLITGHCQRLLMLAGVPEEQFMQDAVIGWGPVLPEPTVANGSDGASDANGDGVTTEDEESASNRDTDANERRAPTARAKA